MKIFILLLFTMSMISCSEEETFCYECSVTEGSQAVVDSFQRCDITEIEAKRIENAGSKIITPYTTQFVVVYTKKTTCVKKA